MATRRQFIGGSAAMLAAIRAGVEAAPQRAAQELDILVLGGTGFIGPQQISYALDRGHRVTTFNRGRRSGLYGDRVEELIGDRDARVDDGLNALEGTRRWDIVVDNSGYVPRHVRDSAELLKGRCSRYIYTSTVAVYDFDRSPSVDNRGPLLPAPVSGTEAVTRETYGPLKAECDRIVQEIYGEQATIVRPTYIVGPGDTTDRFTYWVERFYRGGDIVCPSGPEQEASWIDVRDLCHWLVHLGENDTPGIFNGTGPASPITRAGLMHGLRACTARAVTLFWPTAELLERAGFDTQMFSTEPQSIHIDASAAVGSGLTYRALADTARDTHEWWLGQSAARPASPPRWPTAAEEAAVLAELRG